MKLTFLFTFMVAIFSFTMNAQASITCSTYDHSRFKNSVFSNCLSGTTEIKNLKFNADGNFGEVVVNLKQPVDGQSKVTFNNINPQTLRWCLASRFKWPRGRKTRKGIQQRCDKIKEQNPLIFEQKGFKAKNVAGLTFSDPQDTLTFCKEMRKRGCKGKGYTFVPGMDKLLHRDDIKEIKNKVGADTEDEILFAGTCDDMKDKDGEAAQYVTSYVEGQAYCIKEKEKKKYYCAKPVEKGQKKTPRPTKKEMYISEYQKEQNCYRDSYAAKFFMKMKQGRCEWDDSDDLNGFLSKSCEKGEDGYVTCIGEVDCGFGWPNETVHCQVKGDSKSACSDESLTTDSCNLFSL